MLDQQRHFTLAVVIATRNRPKKLIELVNSLQIQLQKNDIIVIADASDSNCNHSIESDSRIFYIRNNSRGITSNRNLGLATLEKLKFDYWCFLDDDLKICPDYFEILSKILEENSSDTVVTGPLNSTLIPKRPDWLGYYRKNALTRDKHLLMPHSVGTWIPRQKIPFRYISQHFYGYDELELRKYIFSNQLRIKYYYELNIIDTGSAHSSGQHLTTLEFNQTRLIQNFHFRYLTNTFTIRKYLYIYRCLIHLYFRGDENVKEWSKSMLLHPKKIISWLNQNQISKIIGQGIS